MNSGDRGAEKMRETSLPMVTTARLGSIGVWSGRLQRRPINEAKDLVSIW